MSLLARLQSKTQEEIKQDNLTGEEEVEVSQIQKLPQEDLPRPDRESEPSPKKVHPKQMRSQDYVKVKSLTLKYILKERKDEEVEEIVADLDSIIQVILDENENLQVMTEWDALKEELTNDLIGYGPINPLLHDETVTEIMVNGAENVYAEVGGKLQLTNISFRDNEHVMAVLEKIVAPLGRRIDESSPMVDGRLDDGSRVNAIITPCIRRSNHND